MYQSHRIVNFKRRSNGQAIAWFGEGHELGVINAQCGEDRWQEPQEPKMGLTDEKNYGSELMMVQSCLILTHLDAS